jgi:tRNA(fMet)-specific endonuclease VapC
LQDFLSAYVEVCAFNADDAHAAGEIRAELEKKGKGIGALDTLIAGQCLGGDSVLVTSNTAEFIRVRGLRVEDWAK